MVTPRRGPALSRPRGWGPLWGPRCPHHPLQSRPVSHRDPWRTGFAHEGSGLRLEQSLPKEGRSDMDALSRGSPAAAHSSRSRLPFRPGPGPSPGDANAPDRWLCRDQAEDRPGLPLASGLETGIREVPVMWGPCGTPVGPLWGRLWTALQTPGSQLSSWQSFQGSSAVGLRGGAGRQRTVLMGKRTGSPGNGVDGEGLPVITPLALRASGSSFQQTQGACWVPGRAGSWAPP